jgi:hypothetical protein
MVTLMSTDQIDHYVAYITVTVQPVNKYGDKVVDDFYTITTIHRTITEKSLDDVVTRIDKA